MVCIIDDRQDVWKNAPNLVHVKPYHFFDGTADINAPPEADKMIPEGETSKFGDGTTVAAPGASRRQAKIVKIRKKKVAANGNKIKVEPKPQGKQEEIEEEYNEKPVSDLTSRSRVRLDEDDLNGQKSVESTVSNVTVIDEKSPDAAPENQDASIVAAVDEKSSDAVSENYSDVDVAGGARSLETAAEPAEMHAEKVSEVVSEEEEGEEEEFIEWDDTDDYLIYLEDILQRIHAAFYEMHDELRNNKRAPVPDLKKIVPYVRKKVLRGANILFSGVFPTNQAPENAFAYQLALSLGATVHLNFVAPSSSASSKNVGATTHLVAAKLGTEKVHMVSKSKDVKIVNPDWLWTCGDRWEWVDERLYPLTEETSRFFLFRDSPDPNSGQRSSTASSAAPTDNSAETAEKSSSEVTVEAGNLGMSSSTYADMLKDFENNFAENDDDEEDDAKNEKIDCESESESVKLEEKLRQKVLRKRKHEESSSEGESLSGDYPKGWKKELSEKKPKKMDESEEDNEDLEDSDEEVVLGKGSNNIEVGEEQLSSSDDDSNSGESNQEIEDLAEFIEREYLS